MIVAHAAPGVVRLGFHQPCGGAPLDSKSLSRTRCVPRVQVSANLTRDVVGGPSPPQAHHFRWPTRQYAAALSALCVSSHSQTPRAVFLFGVSSSRRVAIIRRPGQYTGWTSPRSVWVRPTNHPRAGGSRSRPKRFGLVIGARIGPVASRSSRHSGWCESLMTIATPFIRQLNYRYKWWRDFFYPSSHTLRK